MQYGRGSVVVIAAGSSPVKLVDDVLTNTRHSLAPGTGLALDAEPQSSDEEKVWRPTKLPFATRRQLAAATPDELEVESSAIAAIEAGEAVEVRLWATSELRLSQLSDLTEAAQSAPGTLVVKLGNDG